MQTLAYANNLESFKQTKRRPHKADLIHRKERRCRQMGDESQVNAYMSYHWSRLAFSLAPAKNCNIKYFLNADKYLQKGSVKALE